MALFLPRGFSRGIEDGLVFFFSLLKFGRRMIPSFEAPPTLAKMTFSPLDQTSDKTIRFFPASFFPLQRVCFLRYKNRIRMSIFSLLQTAISDSPFPWDQRHNARELVPSFELRVFFDDPLPFSSRVQRVHSSSPIHSYPRRG